MIIPIWIYVHDTEGQRLCMACLDVLDSESDSFLFRLQMQLDIMTQDFAYCKLVPTFGKKNVVEFKTGNCKLRAESRWSVPKFAVKNFNRCHV
jgi:hypothetical protein